MEILRNHAPSLLSACGVAGFITAVVMSARAAPRAYEILKETEDEKPLDRFKAVAPIYAPTAGMILLSTACVVASNRAYKQRYTGLLAIYSIGERTMDRWQKAVVDEVGPKRAEKVRERAVAPTKDEPVPAALLLEEENTVFYDKYSGRYFKGPDIETVRRIINNLNEEIMSGDWVCLNDLYYALGLPPTEFGYDAGWVSYHGLINATFDAHLHDNRAVIGISFDVKPKEF
jgi:hypothetical protein